MSTVPMFDPQGTLRDVPYEHTQDAVAAGGKPAILVQPPSGVGTKPRYVPTDQMQEAVKQGGTIIPLEDQETQHPGFWKNLSDDLVGMGKGLLTPSHTSTDTVASDAAKLAAPAQSEKAAGYSPTYRAAAALTRGTVIVDPTGMEQSAAQGDVAGVAGHAVAAAVPVIAGEVAKGVIPPAAEGAKAAFDAVKDAVGDVTPKHVAQAVGGVTGGVAGHGTLSAPGAYYGAKTAGKIAEGVLGDRANQPIIPPKAPVNPGAPLPEANPEAVQGNALLKPGASPSPEPASALGNPPSAPQSPAQRLPSAFQPLPAKPPAVPGTAEAPFKPLTELPIPAVNQAISELGASAPLSALTERANNIAKLGELLNQGLGGKELEPNVPLKNQGGGIVPKANGAIPEGHTAVDSSAVKSYKYDPAAKELDITTPGGGRYVYGEISPDQAEAFGKGEYQGKGPKDAPSVGKAWADIRNNGVLVKKAVNGKLQPVKPVVSPEDQVSEEEWQHGHALGTEVEGSPR
jgi:hypothetical protein